MRLVGITHVALELSSPTRMERWLRDTFGLQLLRQGYLRGEYVRIMGSPHHQHSNPGFLYLYNRPFIPRGSLRHIAVGIDGDVEQAVADLRRRGFEVDVEDCITGPDGLRFKIDSLTAPRPLPVDDPVTRLADAPVDVSLSCMWRGIDHVAPDAPRPSAIQDWLIDVFGFDARRTGDRRGEYFSHVWYTDNPRDPIGRPHSYFPTVLRPGAPRVNLNHIAFETKDADGALADLERRGIPVDLPKDCFIYAPEEVWYQIDSRETPFPIGHVANDPAVSYISAKFKGVSVDMPAGRGG
jgi:catechol 2,3-dioxygenase-like lactoylglutathione lyase family enzyme